MDTPRPGGVTAKGLQLGQQFVNLSGLTLSLTGN